MRSSVFALALIASAGCGSTRNVVYHPSDDAGTTPAGDLAMASGTPDLAQGPGGCGEVSGCYTVYAHGDHTLYKIDLANKMLITVGPFKAPMVSGREDTMTDLAVAPDNTIYVVSKQTLYTADPVDGHVTPVGPVSVCGADNVALTFTADGNLYVADHLGAFCRIDLTTKPPTVKPIATLANNLAVSGDLVAVADGTMYATAYDTKNSATSSNNYLVKIDPASGKVTQNVGSTGFPKLYGVAFEEGVVFGFTHDGTGTVVTIDPKTGKGTLYNKFLDPDTNMGISFAGAGVNSMVVEPPPG